MKLTSCSTIILVIRCITTQASILPFRFQVWFIREIHIFSLKIYSSLGKAKSTQIQQGKKPGLIFNPNGAGLLDVAWVRGGHNVPAL